MLKQVIKSLPVTVILVLLSLYSFAQDSTVVDGNSLDSVMRSHDKIYVVMAVCIVILVILLVYLVRIDTKISRKEKNA